MGRSSEFKESCICTFEVRTVTKDAQNDPKELKSREDYS